MGESRRALLEVSYGRETLGDLPRLIALVDRIQNPGAPPRLDAPRPARTSAPQIDPRLAALGIAMPTETRAEKPAEFRINMPPAPTVVRAASSTSVKQPATTPKPLPQMPAAPRVEPSVAKTKAATAKSETKAAPKQDARLAPKLERPDPRLAALALKPEAQPEVANETPKTRPHTSSETAVVVKGARTFTHAEPMDLEAPVDMLIRTGVVKPSAPARPAVDIEPLLRSLTPTGSGIDAAAMAAQRSALLTSARDIRATDAALDAAQRLLALGKLQSASDVLLDLIAHGFQDREAQRLLIEVDCALGRRDVAKEKCTLLGQAYRLDGRRDVAEDVDRLARIL